MRRAGIGLGLLLLACAGCALEPRIAPGQLEGWRAVEIGEVRLLGDVGDESLQRFADDLALFDAVFRQLAGWRADAAGLPARIFLIGDSALARRFGLGRGRGGWALASLDGGFSAIEAQANHESTRSVLFHEYVHLLLRRNRRAPLPPWYDEGLASFFATFDARDGAVVVGASPGATVAWLTSRQPLPLAELFEGDVWGRSARGVSDFYATAWALSHYLLLSPQGRREMSRLADQLARGASPEEAQRAAFGRSTGAVEAELRTHLAHLARGAPAEVVFDRAAFSVRAARRPALLAPPDAACELGMLSLQITGLEGDARQRALAGRLLEEASASGGSRPHCRSALAEVRALGGDSEAAQLLLGRALAEAPEDARVRLHGGRVELARADGATGDAAGAALAAAEVQFRRALELEPGSAAAWFGLGDCLRRSGRTEDALAAMQQARRFGWSPALDLALGEMALARGEERQAFELLWPLAGDPHGGPARDRASELLEQAGLPREASGKTPP